MDTPHLVEAMLAGLIGNDEACQAYPDLGYLRHRAELTGVPLQWLLAVADLPLARGLLRHMAQALLGLIAAAEAGWQDGACDGCGLWHALRQAPPWLLRPDEADDEETDIALLLLRDEQYGGDWNALIEALHHGGIANQVKVNLHWIESEVFENEDPAPFLEGIHGIMVPGGFGQRKLAVNARLDGQFQVAFGLGAKLGFRRSGPGCGTEGNTSELQPVPAIHRA